MCILIGLTIEQLDLQTPYNSGEMNILATDTTGSANSLLELRSSLGEPVPGLLRSLYRDVKIWSNTIMSKGMTTAVIVTIMHFSS